MKTSSSSVQPKLIQFHKTEDAKRWKVQRWGHRSPKVVSCGQKNQPSGARAQEDQMVMLPHMPATKVKKPGQASHEDVLQNKNSWNVNIVNIQSQKASLHHEQFKKPATMYKYKYKKHQEEVIHYDKQCQETKQSVCEGKKSTQCSDKKSVIKNKDVQSREPVTERKSSLCRDKNCQSPQFVRPKKPRSHMWSVTKKTDVQLPKPAIRRLCNEKNCQSTRCYKKYWKCNLSIYDQWILSQEVTSFTNEDTKFRFQIKQI